MIDISVEIAEGQLKRFIEKRARFFGRERANAAADRAQEQTNQSGRAAALAAE